LIQHLLTTKPTERYGNLKDGSNDIKNHPWFASCDFEDVFARQVKPPFVPTVKFDGDTRCFDYYEELQMPYHLMETNNDYCDHFANF
jgi:protein kinase A